MSNANNKHFEPREWLSPNSYSNYASLPDKPGVYLLVAVDIGMPLLGYMVLYVGMSDNLKYRLSNHPIIRHCRDKYKIVNIYFKRSRSNLRKLEKELILKFHPLYNKQHNK